MRLTSVLRVVWRHGNREPVWYEVKSPKLPEGFKIFDYSPKYYATLMLLGGAFTYVKVQSEIHPESVWADIMRFVNRATKSVSTTVSTATGTEGEGLVTDENAESKSGFKSSSMNWIKRVSSNISHAAEGHLTKIGEQVKEKFS